MFRLLLGFLLLGMGFPRVCADERILSFHSRIEVKDLGSLLVTETIRVRFEGKKREEDLYRDLPPGAHGKVVRFERDGKADYWQAQGLRDLGVTRVWLGSPGEVVAPGTYTYVLVYRVSRQHAGFTGTGGARPYLSRDINGTGWSLPFDEVSAVVEFPGEFSWEGAKISGRTGPVGSTRGDEGKDYEAAHTESGFAIETTRALGREEALSFKVRIPPALSDSLHRDLVVKFAREPGTSPSRPRRGIHRGTPPAAERILSFDSRIVVEKSGELLVTETIKVRAGGRKIKRGIFRDIPLLGDPGPDDKLANLLRLKKQKSLEVLSVRWKGPGQSSSFREEKYQVSSQGFDGDWVRIRIGRKEVRLAHGEHTYEIVYRTGRQLYFEDERDVLYWNVNGTAWDFPADRVSATVELPEGIKPTKVWGYTGKFGEKGKDYEAVLTETGGTISANRVLSREENLTVVLEWPPGLLDAQAKRNTEFSLGRDHPKVVIGGLLLGFAGLYFLLAWLGVGKDPRKGTIIPRYGPPEGLSAAAARYIREMAYDAKCFSAGVVGLGARGALQIEKKKKYWLRKSGKYLERQKGKQAIPVDEAILRGQLFSVSASLKLHQPNHEVIGKARKAHRNALKSQINEVHFKRNVGWFLPGLVLSLGACFFLGSLFAHVLLFVTIIPLIVLCWRLFPRTLNAALISFYVIFALFAGLLLYSFKGTELAAMGTLSFSVVFLCMIMNHVFFVLIKAPTRLGRRLMDEIEGFRHYLRVGEGDRLRLYAPPETPEKTLDLFEEFLPYALALDCEQQWSDQFDGVLRAAGIDPSGDSYSPSFYSGGTGSVTGSMSGMSGMSGMMSGLSGGLTKSLSASASAPSSGGGGFGGGFGGGGGGGGGGDLLCCCGA